MLTWTISFQLFYKTKNLHIKKQEHIRDMERGECEIVNMTSHFCTKLPLESTFCVNASTENKPDSIDWNYNDSANEMT